MIRTLVFLSLAGMSPLNFAFGEANYCSDLYGYACGSENGGANNSYIKARSSAVEAEVPEMKADFSAALSAPKSPLKDLALQSPALKKVPECTADPKSGACEQKIAERLASLASEDISFRLPGQFKSDDTLRTIVSLREDLTYQKIVERAKTGIVRKFVPDGLESRIRDQIFPEAKQLLISKVQSLDIKDSAKQAMIKKLKEIQFGGTDCVKSREGADVVLDQELVPNAFYDPRQNKFYICKGLMSSQQKESAILFVIAHELSHSIDPCGSVPDGVFSMQEKMDSSYPISNLVRCLRSEDSISAKRFKTNWDWVDKIVFQSRWPICERDQIGESTADWFAAEALGQHFQSKSPPLVQNEVLEGVANISQSMCPIQGVFQASSIDPHPQSSDRINKILLMNPDIRKKMGCSNVESKTGYCDGQNAQAIRARVSSGSANSSNKTSRGVK